MPAPPRPLDQKLYGRENHGLALAVANLQTPTVGELTALTGLDITNFYFQDGTTWPTPETATVDAPKRGGDTVVYPSIGDTTYGAGTLIFAAPPQAIAGSDGRKLLEMIPEGSERVLWNRPGIPAATDILAEQVFHLWRVEFGPPSPTKVGEGPAARAAATSTFVVREVAFWRPAVAS